MNKEFEGTQIDESEMKDKIFSEFERYIIFPKLFPLDKYRIKEFKNVKEEETLISIGCTERCVLKVHLTSLQPLYIKGGGYSRDEPCLILELRQNDAYSSTIYYTVFTKKADYDSFIETLGEARKGV